MVRISALKKPPRIRFFFGGDAVSGFLLSALWIASWGAFRRQKNRRDPGRFFFRRNRIAVFVAPSEELQPGANFAAKKASEILAFFFGGAVVEVYV